MDKNYQRLRDFYNAQMEMGEDFNKFPFENALENGAENEQLFVDVMCDQCGQGKTWEAVDCVHDFDEWNLDNASILKVYTAAVKNGFDYNGFHIDVCMSCNGKESGMTELWNEIAVDTDNEQFEYFLECLKMK